MRVNEPRPVFFAVSTSTNSSTIVYPWVAA